MVPPQLVEKWAREAFLTLPGIRVFLIDDLRNGGDENKAHGVNEVRLRQGHILREGLQTTLSELRLRKDSASPRKRWLSLCGRPSLVIVGRERANLGYFWRHAYRVPRSGPYVGCVVNCCCAVPVFHSCWNPDDIPLSNFLDRSSPLQYLTLVPFRRALPDHLFHRYRAWCPLCYEHWQLNGQTVYEPLLWAIKTSPHCTVHQRPLRHDCPHCGRLLNPLGVFAQPGHCERCGGWLGVSHAGRDQASPVEENQTWTCTQIGGLLALLPLIDAKAARESFRRNLNVYLNELASGNVLAFAE